MGHVISLLGLGSSWLRALGARVLPKASGSGALGELFMWHFPKADMHVSRMFFQLLTLILTITSSDSQPASGVGGSGEGRDFQTRLSRGVSRTPCDPQTIETSPL